MHKAPAEVFRRVLTALLLLPWLPLAALYAADWLPLLWGLLWLLCLWEWAALAGAGRTLRLLCLVLFTLAALAVSLWLPQYASLLLAAAAIFWMLVPLLLAGALWPRSTVWRLLLAVPVIFPAYIAILLLYLHPWDFIYLLLLVWTADSAAWFCGRRWGRHKLAAAISPGKTIEGVAGAAAAVALLAVLWPLAGTGSLPPLQLLLVSMLVFAASVLGDLLESCAKRAAGRKDSGSLLPGHGGLLDRLDSMAAAAPVFACCLWLLR